MKQTAGLNKIIKKVNVNERQEILENVKSVKQMKHISEEKKDEIYKELFTKGREKIEATYQNLLNKPNMTISDRDGMKKCIDYLVKKKFDTPENFKNLESINYGTNFIEIGGIKLGRLHLCENFITIKEGVFSSGPLYFTPEAYSKECKEQGLKPLTSDILKKVLAVFPKVPETLPVEQTSYRRGPNMLGFILGMMKRTDEFELSESGDKLSFSYTGFSHIGTLDGAVFAFDEHVAAVETDNENIKKRQSNIAVPCLYLVD